MTDTLRSIAPRLRELLAKATPGPWSRVMALSPRDDWRPGRIVNHRAEALIRAEDAELACSLVNAAPALVELLEAAVLAERDWSEWQRNVREIIGRVPADNWESLVALRAALDREVHE